MPWHQELNKEDDVILAVGDSSNTIKGTKRNLLATQAVFQWRACSLISEMVKTTESVHLLVDRMKPDYQSIVPRMRKLFGSSRIETFLTVKFQIFNLKYRYLSGQHRSSQEVLQRLCAVFLAALKALKGKAPEKIYIAAEPGLRKACLGCSV